MLRIGLPITLKPILVVDRMGLEPIKSILQGSTVPLYTAHKIGGDRRYRTDLDKVLARHLRSPLLPPYIQNWWMKLESNQQCREAADLQSAGVTNFPTHPLFVLA